MPLDQTKLEALIKEQAPSFSEQIKSAAQSSHNEAEFRTKITRFIEEFVQKARLENFQPREEYTLITGRADAVYNRLIIEYEPPLSLHNDNAYRTNQHAIGQTKGYITGLVRAERHKPERVAGVVLDGKFFIFVRHKENLWYIQPPLKVESSSTEIFLKLLISLSTEKALIPENLVSDFGENTNISRKAVRSLYQALITSDIPKVKTLFDQWALQFGEVCDYEKASKIKIEQFARNFGITDKNIEPFKFFFCIHTYYAVFIKLLAVQIIHYYAMPKLGTDLHKSATFDEEELNSYLRNIEAGGIFKELGILNFLEGDFFGWYLDIWNDNIYQSAKNIISSLANYSLVTLDVDPDQTRDLLKKLYQHLMPKVLRHNLGEYYTPDWLAERLLNMLEAGEFKGEPDKRVLDPACGSGTFLVIAIKKIREYARDKMLNEPDILDKILANIVGFDLNPLAVISARTNYLLALGDLLQHRKGDINIPVYLCDSIMTPSEGGDIFSKGILKFNTAVGPFAVPKSLVQAQYIDILANFLEEVVKLNYDNAQFVSKLTQKLPLTSEKDKNDIDIILTLYDKLINLQRQNINGIWSRIIKNAFAPLFVGEFDYVAGNPPWVNWENLPERYRRDSLNKWHSYGLIPPKGLDAILGRSKMDISVLMSYVSMDKYLKSNGKLGFLITQSVFKTGAGDGFRQFTLPKAIPVQVMHVDDMVELQPFEGASNRTSVVVLQKGKPTKYPMTSYLYWRKSVKRKSIALDSTLDDVLQMTERKQFVAEPVDVNDITSPWITGRPKALRAVKRVLGRSDYVAHAGCYTGGANGVYWVDILTKRPDGFVVVSNIIDRVKIKVENIQTAIEADLLYPLLRSRDLKRWKAEPSAHIIMTRIPELIDKKAIPEQEMKSTYPKTFLYLERFKSTLLNRRDAVLQRSFKSIPFYSLAAVGGYTFASYKVVWTRIAKIEAAVISEKVGKSIIPQETITLVALNDKKEAYYLAGMVNSAPFQYAAVSYSQKGGKSMGSMHVLENIRIPKFASQNNLHLQLSELSEQAHNAAEKDDAETIKQIEYQINQLSAQIWGVTNQELKEIKLSLEELT